MSLKVFPHYPQQESADCGLSCLRMVTKYYGKAYSAEILRKRCFISKEGVSMLSNYLLTTISDSYPQGAIRKNLFGGIAPFSFLQEFMSSHLLMPKKIFTFVLTRNNPTV